MDSEHTEKTLGRQIRSLRMQSEMTQEDLAKELNVTRQALSNWERDVNEPDITTIEKICLIFGIKMDELVREAMMMEAVEKKGKGFNAEKRKFNKYDMAIGLMYAAGFFIGAGIALRNGKNAYSIMLGICFIPAFGLLAHAFITLYRKDR